MIDLRRSLLVDTLERVFEEMEQAEREEAEHAEYVSSDYWYRWRALYVVRRLLGA